VLPEGSSKPSESLNVSAKPFTAFGDFVSVIVFNTSAELDIVKDWVRDSPTVIEIG